jgi:hypothetical protein
MQPQDDPWQSFSVRFDDNGYMLPVIEYRKQALGKPRDLRQPRERTPNSEYYSFMAGGIMPEDVRAQFAQALASELPSEVPPDVPQWLEAQPVFAVIFLPGGEVVTRGALGSWTDESIHYEQTENRTVYKRPQADDGWYRYSANGEFLGKVVGPTAQWQQLYNPQMATLQMSAQSQGYQVDGDGRYTLWRKPTGEAVAAWDYDGTPVPLDKPLLTDPGQFKYWRWEDLQKARAGQINMY